MYELRVVLARALRRSTVLVVFLLAALVLVGAVSAGSGGSYKGKTKPGKWPVSFRVSGKSVIGFKMQGDAYCHSADSSNYEVYSGVVTKKGTLTTAGRFVISYVKSGLPVKITGRVSGSSASGSVNLQYWKAIGVAPNVVHAICTVKATWSAKRAG